MPKSKQGPALFELMRESRRGSPEDGSAPEIEADQPPPPPRDLEEEAPTPAPEPVACMDDPDSGTGPVDIDPFCETAGGRIRISLTQSAATIAAAVAILMFAAVGYVGHRVGVGSGIEIARQAALDMDGNEIDLVRQDDPTPGLFDGIGVDPTTGGGGGMPSAADGGREARPGAGHAWTVGYNYIVVQDFWDEGQHDARTDALAASAYLKEQGVDVEIVELRRSTKYKYRLITVAGFDLEATGQQQLADDYLERVRRIGRAYSEGGGRYDFQSAYLRKLTGDRW